ncbi:ejaculatory bulb-specific protein 3-like [Macrosteles quadrilineatus]|uniref:ejaculatory bulb-specific protein 3-like n=1 Tax=Macrosteles quadrilineatus TaxID=74068 RepID=UPI0023E0EDC2|nr:ejaculatory bulb-specific protein 3-like [Macrosteles quadrilineatus]
MYVVLLLACAALTVAAPGPAAPKQLNSRLDSVDVDKILANPRVLSNYVKCVTDKGPCTSEGKDLKKILPEVISTACANCSPKMRANLKKTILAMRQKYPNEWTAVVNKYDPKRTHSKDLEAFLKS